VRALDGEVVEQRGEVVRRRERALRRARAAEAAHVETDDALLRGERRHDGLPHAGVGDARMHEDERVAAVGALAVGPPRQPGVADLGVAAVAHAAPRYRL
jgi:hypothetical protein